MQRLVLNASEKRKKNLAEPTLRVIFPSKAHFSSFYCNSKQF